MNVHTCRTFTLHLQQYFHVFLLHTFVLESPLLSPLELSNVVLYLASKAHHDISTPPLYPLLSSPPLTIHLPVTGPVARFARQIASQGYIVAAPSSYHEFTGPEPLAYDVPGTDAGNEWKVCLPFSSSILLLYLPFSLSLLLPPPSSSLHPLNTPQITKTLPAYDEDATLSVSLLLSLPTCTGRIGTTGMCLGGHLAYRCALDPRVSAAVCYFATDIHSRSLGKGKNDDSLERAAEIRGEVVMIFGKLDNHVSGFPCGRAFAYCPSFVLGLIFGWNEGLVLGGWC